MIYVHPVLGVLTIALMLWIGMQGLWSRHHRPYAPPARAVHRVWAPRVLILVCVVVALGTATARLLRPDVHQGATWHFRFAWSMLVVMTVAWWLSRRLPADGTARTWHPWLGMLAMALAVGVGVMGLGMLP